MSGFLSNIWDRFGVALAEPGTWRGIIMIATAFGASLDEEQQNSIITTGIAVVGLIGVFFKDDKKSLSIRDRIDGKKEQSISEIDNTTNLSDIVSGTRDEK